MVAQGLAKADAFSTVRAKLEEWRLGGRRGRRIPEHLWSEAVKLARVHGVSKTSVALRLDFYGLQQRLVRVGAHEVPAAPGFVELTLGGLGGAPDCVVVVDGGQGRLLRIELRGAAISRLESLAVALAGACS